MGAADEARALLADLDAFPTADRAAWVAKVGERLEGDADELLARVGEDGASRLPVYTAAELPASPAAPSTWRTRPLVNLADVDAPDADAWRDTAEAELAAGATGIASGFLPRGAEPHAAALVARDVPLVLGAPPEKPFDGAWTLAHDPFSFTLATGAEGDRRDAHLARTIEMMSALRAPDRRHGAVHLQHYAAAGASASQELGLLAATLAEYARRVEAAGGDPVAFLSGLALVCDLTTDVFASVAKLRAARVLWSKVLAAHGVAEDPAPWIVARTGYRTWSALDPETNWIRASVQATAAYLGGADACVVLPHDRATSDTPSPTARRTARDTLSVLGLEGHLDRVEDPARGSYFVEAETDRLAREGWSFFTGVEGQGGLVRSLDIGAIPAAIASARAERRARLAAGDAKLVGVTAFRRDADGPAPTTEPSPAPGSWILSRESAPWEVQP